MYKIIQLQEATARGRNACFTADRAEVTSSSTRPGRVTIEVDSRRAAKTSPVRLDVTIQDAIALGQALLHVAGQKLPLWSICEDDITGIAEQNGITLSPEQLADAAHYVQGGLDPDGFWVTVVEMAIQEATQH